MLKRLTMLKRCVIIAGLLGAATAHADVQSNGVWLNGVELNGVQLNGPQLNGVQLNGPQLNGVQLNGVQLNGTELRGSFIGSAGATAGGGTAPFRCLHKEDVVGGMLPPSCSPCAAVVVASLPSCATTSWSPTCVAKAQSMCVATITTGSSLPTASGDAFVITARSNGGLATGSGGIVDNTDVWWNTLNWKIPHPPNRIGVAMGATIANACVRHVLAQNPDCGLTIWGAQCVAAANSLCTTPIESAQLAVGYGDSLCGYDDNNNARQALFLDGVWNQAQGVAGGGAKSYGPPSAPTFSIGCRKVGAIAKCVDFGYKPWRSAKDDERHQACVRMVRADYCGDGTPWTVNGTQLNVWDHDKIQTDTKPWTFEAAWTAEGASCVNSARLETTLPGKPMSIHEYARSRAKGACSVGSWMDDGYFGPQRLVNTIASCGQLLGFHSSVVSEKYDAP